MTRVLGLVGVSFCGSTILEMLLQTHPRIVGVGELWRACGERYQGGLCWQCGSDCALLDPSVLPLSYSNLHHQLYARADVDWLVDGSKWPGHFIRAQREQSDVELRVVLLIKRPEWAVASFLRRERDVDYAVRAFVDWYSSAARWLRESDVPYIVLPYEEMALNFPAALRRVLALLDGTWITTSTSTATPTSSATHCTASMATSRCCTDTGACRVSSSSATSRPS